MSAETCRACDANGAEMTLAPGDDLPLCGPHWNRWLNEFVSLFDGDEKPEPPCAAHLIVRKP